MIPTRPQKIFHHSQNLDGNHYIFSLTEIEESLQTVTGILTQSALVAKGSEFEAKNIHEIPIQFHASNTPIPEKLSATSNSIVVCVGGETVINCRQCLLVFKCAEHKHTLHQGLKPKCAASTTGKTSGTDCTVNQAESAFLPYNTSVCAKGTAWATPVQAWLWIEVPLLVDSFMTPLGSGLGPPLLMCA